MYTYQHDGKRFVTSPGSYVFDEEAEAATWCEMWNAHSAALRPLRELPVELSRAEYEAACAHFGAEVLLDAQCDSYTVKYGEFHPWLEKGQPAGYTPEYAVKMALAKGRMRAIQSERAQRPKPPRPEPDYPDGRLLDCGHVVYWANNVMSASNGSSCLDCYDRMSD